MEDFFLGVRRECGMDGVFLKRRDAEMRRTQRAMGEMGERRPFAFARGVD